MPTQTALRCEQDVSIPAGDVTLEGTLGVPAAARGIVLFAHGSGSSRHSRRNRFVAQVLQGAGIGTLLFDLLTHSEEAVDLNTREHRFDIELLTGRLVQATQWLAGQEAWRGMRLGYFGSSTGSAAAMFAAAELGHAIDAVVSRGGRPDMADPGTLSRVTAPTLLIVGGHDDVVIELNQRAYAQLRCEKQLVFVPGASHLFEEPGALEAAAGHARDWLVRHLGGARD